ncbi:MAG: hypothetical protein PHY62_00985 [Gallionella sp.]|nr:hypothetical protein [Gallionella sp.]
MLLWLPLSTGSALAASVSMQMQSGECHKVVASHEVTHNHADAHDHHLDTTTVAAEVPTPACTDCGICHLACAAYVSVPALHTPEIRITSGIVSNSLETFASVTTLPLLPPPLVHA